MRDVTAQTFCEIQKANATLQAAAMLYGLGRLSMSNAMAEAKEMADSIYGRAENMAASDDEEGREARRNQ